MNKYQHIRFVLKKSQSGRNRTVAKNIRRTYLKSTYNALNSRTPQKGYDYNQQSGGQSDYIEWWPLGEVNLIICMLGRLYIPMTSIYYCNISV